MLINLSNHPQSIWDEKQLQLAESEYGEIIDLPFPVVPPNADKEKVLQLAWQTMIKICDQYKNENFTVHIMGEMTFVYALVGLLQKKNIKCIASTTQRISESLANRERRVVFNFQRFREYPEL